MKKLPPSSFRRGHRDYLDDSLYLQSAINETERLVTYTGLNANSKVLDIGCGSGKLLIGILESIGEIRYYYGIDVDHKAITWCNNNLKLDWTKFTYIGVRNDRYNPAGYDIDGRFSFPTNQHFDIIYLYSVFSHMITNDIRLYLKEFKRLLKPGGYVFLTIFVEDNVPDMTINPDNYIGKWSGKLACVRYNRQYFESLLDGFQIDRFIYRETKSKQSVYYLRKL